MRKVSLLVVVALFVTSCGSGGGADGSGDLAGGTGTVEPTGMIESGLVTDDALASIVRDDGKVDEARMAALVAEVLALPEPDQQALLADLSLRAEVGIAAISGLAAEAGGADGFAAAAARAWRPVDELVRAPLPLPSLSSSMRSAATSTPDGMAMTGLFLGYMGLGMTAGSMVERTNRLDPDVVETSDGVKDGMSLDYSLNAVSLGLQYKGTEKDGMEVEFSARSELQVCPAENGLLEVSGLIDVTVRKNGKAQHAVVDAKLRLQVGDDAEVVSREGETRVKWSASDGGAEQSIDVTYTSGSKNDVTINGLNIFTTTPEFARAASVMGRLVGDLVLSLLQMAVERGWKSGRCVQLNVTPSAGPSGMEPGQTATVMAQPRSKIDRSPTGGTVTAVLSSGETSIDPASTPLQADAEFTYTAPGEKDENGTVDFESKSKRGIGKASITFDTNGRRWYAEYSGEISISGDVPSLTADFQLEGEFEGGTATFSFFPTDERGGSFTINGGGSGATVTGGGTYTVTDNDDGTKTLTATGNACVDVSGICRDVEHPIKLSPR